MKIQILSDLHIDTKTVRRDYPFDIATLDTDADAILIPGDVSGRIAETIEFLEQVARVFPNKQIIAVPGNHEYERGNFIDVNMKILEFSESNKLKNLHLLNDTHVVIDNIAFFGSVFWTMFNLFNQQKNMKSRDAAEKNFYDYQEISYGETLVELQPGLFIPQLKRLTTKHTVAAHKYALRNLKEFLVKYDDKKKVVLTHHAPSELSINEKYGDDETNNCFASNHTEFIKKSKIDLWAHGHTHTSFDYFIGDTRIICNPRGYGFENLYGFSDALTVEL